MAEQIIRCRPLLGTFVEITADSDCAIGAAFEAVGRAHALMSSHEPDSDVGRINRFAHRKPVDVHPWTAEVLDRALLWARRSAGLFDIVAVGASALASGHLPRHAGQPTAESRSSADLLLDDRTVRLVHPACIDLGGIAKGFAVDHAIAALKLSGAEFGLVNAGGDLAGFGPQPWPVQVVEPESRRAIANVAVSNGAVATSAILPGGSAGHLVGRASEIASATVCAPRAMDADALAKIVLSGSAIASACLEVGGAQAFVLASDGSIRSLQPERRAA